MKPLHEENNLHIPDTFGTSPEYKYYGLQNQGSTCYLNSVLQVLFMTGDFREAVERQCCQNSNTMNIDPQLKNLFDELKAREAYTYLITQKLGIDKVNEQRDAAEYFEKILSLTSHKASQIFHGQLTHRNTCSVCKTQTDADGAFWSLPLAMRDSYSEDYSVRDGIEAFFRPSRVSGENQMYCDGCDAKADATIECKIKDHPEALMLLLKRFEFDYNYMQYVKINCSVDVPRILQIPESHTYELYAVVHHFGDLRGGHYTATIKSQDDGRWYEFNDARVTLLDPQPFQGVMQQSRSAYLLIYRKNKIYAPDTSIQQINQEPSSEDHQLDTNHYPEQSVDLLKDREREEGDKAAEEGNDTVEAVSTERHEGGREEMEDRAEANVRYRGAESVAQRQRECVTKFDLCRGLDSQSAKSDIEHQDKGRVGDVGQNMPHEDQECKEEIVDTYTRHSDLKDVTVEKAGEVLNDKGDREGRTGEARWIKPGEAQGKEDYSVRQIGTSGKVGLREHQRVGGQRRPYDSQEYKGLEDIHTNTRPEDVKEDIMESMGISKKAEKHYVVVRIDQEEKQTHDGIQRTNKRHFIGTVPRKKSPERKESSPQGCATKTGKGSMTKRQAANDGESVKGKHEPKADAQNDLSKGVHNLRLNESTVAKEKRRGSKRNSGKLEENEEKILIPSSVKKTRKEPDTLIEGGGVKHRSTGLSRFLPCVGPSRPKEKKKKLNKNQGCLFFPALKAGKGSESESE